MRAPTVNGPNQPPERDLGGQKTNALVRCRFTGLVIHQQQHAGNHLDNEEEHRDTAEVIPTHPMRPDRHFLVAQELNERRELIAAIEPAAQASTFSRALYVRLVLEKRRFHRQVGVGRDMEATAAAAALTIRGR